MVVPNSIYSNYSKGSNELIKQGAYVYTKPEDIFNLLKLEYKGEQKINLYVPTPIEKEILTAIQNNIQTTQEIIEHIQHLHTVSEIIQALLNLEIEEVVRRIDGRYISI
jgi:DNA processing protein